MARRPAVTWLRRATPKLSARAKMVPSPSSNAKKIACSPRSAAATANATATVDFPTPAPPMSRALVPRCKPPPNGASRPSEPLDLAFSLPANAVARHHNPGPAVRARLHRVLSNGAEDPRLAKTNHRGEGRCTCGQQRSARICRRYHSEFCARSRISERLSNTTRTGSLR